METNEDNQSKDRPSASELLGTTPDQITRQGKSVDRDEPNGKYMPKSGSIFQLYIGTASIILLILGIIALGIWLITAEDSEPPTETVLKVPASFMQTDDRIDVQVTNTENIITRLNQLPVGEYTNETLTQILFTENNGENTALINGDDLFRAIGNPLSITRYLESDYMYGRYYSADGEIHPYMVFAISDYNNAYGTILQTELELVSAFEPFGFPAVSNFTDDIIQNQDVRVGNAGGEPLFYYSFPRQNRLVITTSEEALREIFNRIRRR